MKGDAMPISELRLVLTVKDFDRAAALFRDALGLEQLAAWQNDGGHVVLLDAGRATLEVADERQAQAIDEIEVGRRVAGQVRIAFQTPDSESVANTRESGRHDSGGTGAHAMGRSQHALAGTGRDPAHALHSRCGPGPVSSRHV